LDIIHGIWANNNGICMYIWGESKDKALSSKMNKYASSSKSTKINMHPFSLDQKEIANAIGHTSAKSSYEELTISIPTRSKPTIPIPSIDTEIPDDISIAPWKINVIKFEILDGVRIVNLIEDNRLEEGNGIICANDMIFCTEIVKFCVELVIKQRYVPDVKKSGKLVGANWRPVLNDSAEVEKLQFFEKSMPMSLMQFIGKESVGGFISGLINGIVDSVVRSMHNLDVEEFKDSKLEDFWMRSLSSTSNNSMPANESTKLLDRVEEWMKPIGISNSNKGFTTSFRLRTPNESEPGDEPMDRHAWRIDYMLQSINDPSLFIDARNVWANRKEVRSVAADSAIHPQDILLQDLSIASRFFKPIGESLKGTYPTHCDIDIVTLNKFLKDAAPLLRESGFSILLPSWLTTRSKVTVELQIKPRNDCGVFGLGTLVDFEWSVAVGDKNISKEEFLTLVKLKSDIVNMSGKWVGLEFAGIERTINMLNGLDGKIDVKSALTLALSEDNGIEFSISSNEKRISEMLSGLTGNDAFKILSQPSTLNATLRPYQVTGYSWLSYLNNYGIGACLADDMGLGKTMQFISVILEKNRNKDNKRPNLLVCPTSIVGNWSNELRKFAPSIKFAVHHGSGRLKGKSFLKMAKDHDLIISTYQLAHRDMKHLSRIGWGIVALDEAQNIKNYYAKQSRAVKSINSESRIALTGTPMENRLIELWSIMDFLNPGYLGTLNSFIDDYATPIERYRDKKKEDELKRRIKPFVLRRMKTDKSIIKDLPDKIESKEYCSLTKEQASLYQAVVDKMMDEIGQKEGIKRSGFVLIALLRLKQICDHPSLYMPSNGRVDGRSGKLERLEEMLDEALQNSESSLVFTQYAEMGIMLKQHLQSKLHCEVIFLSGKTPRKERDMLVKRFQESGRPIVFILSLKAGGFGLNLTAANHVFHFDRWWNPAVENQATDRAYRIGQHKKVNVHKFITKGTLEEKIDNMLDSKAELTAGILASSSEAWITRLGNEQLRELFKFSG